MYCPVCFDQTLRLRPSGKGHLALNGKQMSTAFFVFNLEKDAPEKIRENLTNKINEIFEWYSGFNNAKAIERMELFSSEFECENGCSISASSKISLVGELIDRKAFFHILQESAKKYNLKIELEVTDL